MKGEGPLLEQLTRRLANCPPDFLAEPRIGDRGKIYVAAVVSDLLEDLGGQPLLEKDLSGFTTSKPHRRNHLRLVLVRSWLYADEWFRQRQSFAVRVKTALRNHLDGLADLVAADLFVTDPDRREELVRLCLEALELRPQGETQAQAADRLQNLNSVERHRVFQAAEERERRARELREAMKRKQAEEAAARYMRE